MSGFRILGIVLAIVGVVASAFPSWFGPLTGGPEAPADVYEAIERRVRGGMVLGLGLMFIGIPSLRPWSASIPLVILYFMTGALAARLLGLIVDGAVPKQWLLVAIETGAMTLVALWLWQSGGSTSELEDRETTNGGEATTPSVRPRTPAAALEDVAEQ